MRYDYRVKDMSEDITQALDTMNGTQLEKVSALIKEMKAEEEKERAVRKKEWLMNTLLVLLKDYAQKTCSNLNIVDKDNEIQVTLENDFGFILSEVKEIQAAIILADYVVVEGKNGVVRLLMVFHENKQNERY